MKHITRTVVLSVALATGLPAQDEAELPTYALDEVVVTSSLWDSGLQNTNASVSVNSEDEIQRSGTQHFSDLVNSVPNLTWSATSSRPRYFQIRGIGENSQFQGETPDSSVRFLVDDLDFTGIGTIGNLFDTRQVES